MPADYDKDWRSFVDDLTGLWVDIKKMTSRNINSKELRNRGRSLVQTYFRTIRSDLDAIGIADELAQFDSDFQQLLVLTNGQNARQSYLKCLNRLKVCTKSLDVSRELAIAATIRKSKADNGAPMSGAEEEISKTLHRLVPTAARCYDQVVADLHATSRVSWRGTACEIRECLREVLDHFARDEDLTAQPGFKVEPNTSGPTMRQKAAFIMKSRGDPDALRRQITGQAHDIDEMFAKLTRSVYERGSLSTHTESTHDDVKRLKRNVDVVMVELLKLTF
ncbi:MAG TPA: hypothetical protein VGL38_12800 [bacterium]|jgi:hypothetical protein